MWLKMCFGLQFFKIPEKHALAMACMRTILRRKIDQKSMFDDLAVPRICVDIFMYRLIEIAI